MAEEESPQFRGSECNDINIYFQDSGEDSVPIVVSPAANQRIQHALKEGDFFSVTIPQNQILPAISSLAASSADTDSNVEDYQSHLIKNEGDLCGETTRENLAKTIPLNISTIRHPGNMILPSFSSASSIVEQLLQPLYTQESPRRVVANTDTDSQNEEEKRAIEDFHKSCSSNFFFFLGALFYFMMDWLDVYDVFLFPHKGYSITNTYVLVFWNRTIETFELNEGESNYTMGYYDFNNVNNADDKYNADYYVESGSNNSKNSTFLKYTEVLVQEPLVTVSISMCFYILGSLCFLMNAIIDFRWAKRLATELKSKRGSIPTSEDFPPLSIQASILQPPQEQRVSLTTNERTSCSDDIDLSRKQLIHNSTIHGLVDSHRYFSNVSNDSSTVTRRAVAETNKLPGCHIEIRRALYPRRETSVKEKIAVLFGLAAVIDFLGALCYDSAPKMSNDAYITAAHLYAAQAFVSIFGKESIASSSNILASLPTISLMPSAEDVGDALFFAGSMIDVIMSYFYALPRMEKSPTFVACSCFASALWLLDSIVYIISTARTRRHAYEDSFAEDESIIKDFDLSQFGPNSNTHLQCQDGSSQNSVT